MKTSRLLSAALLGTLAGVTLISASLASPTAPMNHTAPFAVESPLHAVQYHGERVDRDRGDRRHDRYRGERVDRDWADRRHDLRYDRHRHGERHRHRRHGYTHYYNGYYYATPWWAVVPGMRLPPSHPARPHRTSQRHVRWCFDQYRNYNPETNTYIGRGGRRYVCNSPFY